MPKNVRNTVFDQERYTVPLWKIRYRNCDRIRKTKQSLDQLHFRQLFHRFRTAPAVKPVQQVRHMHLNCPGTQE